MLQDTPVISKVSLKDWLNAAPEIFYESHPLQLTQTYQQWLEENPNGYMCTD